MPHHPVIDEEMKQISDGEKLPPLVDSPQAGAAEALYGLGASIGRRGGEDLALIYLQLALYLEPTQRHGAVVAWRSLRRISRSPISPSRLMTGCRPVSPLSRNAEIQMAVDLDALDRTDEAKKLLENVIADHPKDTEAIIEFGNV